MMALAATGQFDAAQALLDSMREFANAGTGSLHLSYRAAGVPICEAVLAHRRGDHQGVIDALQKAAAATRSATSSISC